MTIACELAIDMLPYFAESVLSKNVRTYGYYANKIGRDSATESMIIGHAMHMIGAACVLGKIPIAPLYYVKRQDENWRGVFEANALECKTVLPHYNTLYVVAREHNYQSSEFERIENGLSTKLRHIGSPHDLWHIVLKHHPKDEENTYFQLALENYKVTFDELKAQRPSKA